MIDGHTMDNLPQYGNFGKLPMAIVRKQNDIVPTNAQDALLANLFFTTDAQTGAPTVYILVNNSNDTVMEDGVSITVQLQKIKEKFGLNLSQLSKVLNVSRPQLYKWLEGESVPQRDDFNQKITSMFSLLGLVPDEHGKYFGKLAKRYVSDEKTVFDVLIDPELDKGKLLAVYNSIKSDIETIDNRKAKERDRYHSSYSAEVILPPK